MHGCRTLSVSVGQCWDTRLTVCNSNWLLQLGTILPPSFHYLCAQEDKPWGWNRLFAECSPDIQEVWDHLKEQNTVTVVPKPSDTWCNTYCGSPQEYMLVHSSLTSMCSWNKCVCVCVCCVRVCVCVCVHVCVCVMYLMSIILSCMFISCYGTKLLV